MTCHHHLKIWVNIYKTSKKLRKKLRVQDLSQIKLKIMTNFRGSRRRKKMSVKQLLRIILMRLRNSRHLLQNLKRATKLKLMVWLVLLSIMVRQALLLLLRTQKPVDYKSNWIMEAFSKSNLRIFLSIHPLELDF